MFSWETFIALLLASICSSCLHTVLKEALCKTDLINLSLNQEFAIQLDSFCELQTHGKFMSNRFLSVFLDSQNSHQPELFRLKSVVLFSSILLAWNHKVLWGVLQNDRCHLIIEIYHVLQDHFACTMPIFTTTNSLPIPLIAHCSLMDRKSLVFPEMDHKSCQDLAVSFFLCLLLKSG